LKCAEVRKEPRSCWGNRWLPGPHQDRHVRQAVFICVWATCEGVN